MQGFWIIALGRYNQAWQKKNAKDEKVFFHVLQIKTNNFLRSVPEFKLTILIPQGI